MRRLKSSNPQLRFRNLDLGFMNKTELLNRTKQFAIDIIEFTNLLPNNSTNKVLGSPLLKAALQLVLTIERQ